MKALLEAVIALAAYRAMTQSDTRVKLLSRNVRDAAWAVFDPWWETNRPDGSAS